MKVLLIADFPRAFVVRRTETANVPEQRRTKAVFTNAVPIIVLSAFAASCAPNPEISNASASGDNAAADSASTGTEDDLGAGDSASTGTEDSASTGTESGLDLAEALDGAQVLDPRGCRTLTHAELRAAGYEPVRAFGATPNDGIDDTDAIQTAIEQANELRRAVYFHPGTYDVRRTLEVKQEPYQTNGNDDRGRYGAVLQGSYCGEQAPTLRLRDGVAPETNEQVISEEPFPVISLWRLEDASTPPDESAGGRDWNQVVRNLRIVLGDNPGAVGIRHHGAEGSSAQEVTIDAHGGFAGLYHANSSGGYTYGITVEGGRYGIYSPASRGGSPVFVGITLRDQDVAPIAFRHYAPITLVGFNIRHEDGDVVRYITGNEGSYSVSNTLRPLNDSGGHIALVDGRIRITGQANAVLSNTDRSIYLSNVHVRGALTVVHNEDGTGDLNAPTTADWWHIPEYSASGDLHNTYGQHGKLIAGVHTDNTWFNGDLIPRSQTITLDQRGYGPSDLIEQHLYPSGLCNVEGADVVFATNLGASPNDNTDDTDVLRSAIAAAGPSGRVFLSAAAADGLGGLEPGYIVSGTLMLQSNTQLCGVSRYATILNAIDWKPAQDSPVIDTIDDPDATTTLADLKIELGAVDGSSPDNYAPHVYGIRWRAGRNSIVRDTWTFRVGADPGPRKTTRLRASGGGRWYGIVQHQGALPPLVGGVRPFYDDDGELTLSQHHQHLSIVGTSEPLTFYSFHLQHLTPPGGSQGAIVDASNVSIFGCKSESASHPDRIQELIAGNDPWLIPTWLRIHHSQNIRLVGYEGLAEQAVGRPLVDIVDSDAVTIVHMGRRNGTSPEVPETQWNFLEETRGTASLSVPANAFMALFVR